MPPTDRGGSGTRSACGELSSAEVAYEAKVTASWRSMGVLPEGGLARKVVALVWAIVCASSGWPG